MRYPAILIPALLLGFGCSDSEDELTRILQGVSDAQVGTVRDATPDDESDGETADAGDTDAAEPDAGELDAGELDAGDLDAGELDGGDADVDAEQPDAAPPSTIRLDFESGQLPPEVAAGSGMVTSSQGFASLGPTGNKFASSFLRSPTNNYVTVSFGDLPPHSSLSLELLFAAIDSLDGSGTPPAGDYFRITIDGGLVFEHTFANAASSSIQSYVPPANVELARREELGFEQDEYSLDSAYDLGADPKLRNIPHTGKTVSITLSLTGGGAANLTDESWAIDNLRVNFGAN